MDGKYCFVYSSQYNHDLCYAMSDRPDGGFTYGGVLVDLGDLYLNGNEDEGHANNYLGNTHGGLLNIGEDWYIFYHRQTNRTSYARQACAEKLERTPDGGFKQAELTSCGLNAGPLKGEGKYEARIACNLWAGGHATARIDKGKKATEGHPYFTQTGKDREENGDQYIANMRDGATAGFKYFDFHGNTGLSVDLWGEAEGTLIASTDPEGRQIVAEVPVHLAGARCTFEARSAIPDGVHPLYFAYHGSGAVNFTGFELK